MKVSESLAATAWANGSRIPDASNASREFESFLVAEVWKQTQRAPRMSNLLGSGAGDRMAREMWIDEIVSRAVLERSMGLAEPLAAARQGGKEDG